MAKIIAPAGACRELLRRQPRLISGGEIMPHRRNFSPTPAPIFRPARSCPHRAGHRFSGFALHALQQIDPPRPLYATAQDVGQCSADLKVLRSVTNSETNVKSKSCIAGERMPGSVRFPKFAFDGRNCLRISESGHSGWGKLCLVVRFKHSHSPFGFAMCECLNQRTTSKYKFPVELWI